MDRIMIVAVIVILLFPVIASAQITLSERTTVSCSSNSTLLTEVNETRCIDGLCRELAIINEQICQFGCFNDTVIPQCAPQPNDRILFFSGAIIAMLAIGVIVLRRM